MSHIETPIFPSGISLNSIGGPQYNTEIVQLNGGAIQANRIWTYPLHKYEVGYGIKDDFDMDVVRAYFHSVGGMLNTFNYLDHSDQLSTLSAGTISDTDQFLYYDDDLTTNAGDGAQTTFQIVKEYITGSLTQQRLIKKIQPGTFVVSLDGTPQTASPLGWTVNEATGIVTFSSPPGIGVIPKCGFKYYVPVRFLIDYLPVTRIQTGFERTGITLMEDRSA